MTDTICFAGFRPAARPVRDLAQPRTHFAMKIAANDVPGPLMAGISEFVIENSTT
jgi:hypothetical protein